MRSTTLRAWFLAVAILVVAPAAGHACNEPSLQVSPTSAGPGDPVQYAITNLTAGGAYQLNIEGKAVASGTAPGTVARGTFTMPDLGGRTTDVSVAGSVEHSDIENSPTGGDTWPVSYPMTYRAPAPAPSPTREPSAGPAPAQAPPAAAPTGQPTAQAPPAAAGRLGTSPSARETPSPAAPERTAPRSSGGRVNGRPAIVSDAAASAAVETRAASSASSSGSGARDTDQPAAAGVSQAVRGAVPIHAWATAAPGSSGGVTPSVAVAVGVLLLAGFVGGGFGFARVRSLRPAPWVPPVVAAEARARSLLMEAELQEMIAERRARELIEAEPAETTPEREPVGTSA
jgi:hypothetical protein